MVSSIKILFAAAFALLLVPSVASADCTGQFQSGVACGNAKATKASPTGTALSPLFDSAFGAPSAKGTVLNRGTSLWSATINPVIGNPGTTTGTLGLGSSSGGTATISPPSTGSAIAILLPSTSGTLPSTATAPLVLNAVTGVLSCPSCNTTLTPLTVGTTPVVGGTLGQVLYTDGAILQAYNITGTGTTAVLATAPTISALTVTGSFTASGLVTNADLVNASTTVNGVTCTLGSTCSVTATAASITVGTTTVLAGTGGYILFNNSGVLGNQATTGSGNVALSVSPTFTGSITAASANFTGTFSISGTPETFPASGLIVGTTDTQVLTNKTIDGSLNTITDVNANTGLTGTVLNSAVVTSSLTTVGTIGTGVWQGTLVAPTYGGTGVSAPTAGDIYKGAGASAMTPSALTDNGTVVATTDPFDLTNQPLVIAVANASSTGTTLNKLAKLTGAPSTALITATTDTGGIVGVVIGGAGTTGSALIAVSGQASCVFDGATTAGDYVQESTGTAGDCSDIGSTYPGSGQAIGRVLSTHVGAGTYAMVVFPTEIQAAAGGGGGTVTSVAVVAGAFINKSGTCSSTSALNCTVGSAFEGGSLATFAGAI